MKKIVMLFTIVLLAATLGFAQNGAFAPYVSGTVATSSTLGTVNPDYKVGVGIESSTKHLLLDINGTVDTADIKPAIAANSIANTTLNLQVSGYYKLFSHLLVGTGANFSQNTASYKTLKTLAAVKTAAQPFVGAGVQLGKLRVIANYDLPGKDAQTNNRVVTVNSEFQLFKHIRVTQTTVIDSYVGTPARVTGTQLGAGLKFVL